MDEQTKQKIQQDIQENKVLLYMKGTPDMPMCGFSAKVTEILQRNGITFVSRNVLDDEQIRQGIKEFANWPTIPQLYVHGTFVGGCDIIVELDQKGELTSLLAAAG